MRIYAAAGCLLLAFLIIYLPDIGHGFIKDDFQWIAASRVASAADAVRLFERNVGFYRPLVSASFAVDYRVWTLDPLGYGLTNLTIFLVDALLIVRLARRLFLPRAAAVVAVAIWAFNFHGVNMALLWISGRTALLMCLFALAAALEVLNRRPVRVGMLSLLAMLCKEEAVLLPVLFAAFTGMHHPDRSPREVWQSVRALWPTWIALGIYLALRTHSGAFGPQNAPPHYQFLFEPLPVLRNMLEYLDRGATVSCAVALVLWLCIRRTPSPLSPEERRVVWLGALWFVCFYTLTVFLPVRSSVYALTPSIGSALAVGAFASAVLRKSARRFELACTALVVSVFLLIPVYRQRNAQWVAPADLSATVVRTLQLVTTGDSPRQVVLVDDPSVRFGLDSSFGGLFEEAVHLVLGPAWGGALVPSLSSNILSENTSARGRLVFVLRNGRLAPAGVD